MTLAGALVVSGQPELARPFFDAAIDLAPDASFAKRLEMRKAMAVREPDLLRDPGFPLSVEDRAALQQGYRALASRDPSAKSKAVQALLAVSKGQPTSAVAWLLADLGANRDAFEVASQVAAPATSDPALLWYPGMRPALDDPGMPALLNQIGLLQYWKTTHTRPDVCSAKSPPAFCSQI